jgi:hypothetical protein
MGIGMSEISVGSGMGPFDPLWTGEARKPSPLRRFLRRGAALALAAAIAVGATLASAPESAPSAVVAVAPPSLSSEVVDSSLAPLFAFPSESPGARYDARIDRATGARRDVYSLGALDGDAPAMRVEMWKDPSKRTPASLFVEIAEEAAAFGAVVERLGVSQIATSLQGPVEWAELTLAGERPQRSCVGFRLAGRADEGLRGVACAAIGAKIDAGDVACLLDRVALTRAGREAGMPDIIKSAGARRSSCHAAIG